MLVRSMFLKIIAADWLYSRLCRLHYLAKFNRIYAGLKYGKKTVVLDIGAHRGWWIERLNAISKNTEIHAFEPNTEHFEELKKKTPHVHSVLLSDCEKKLRFYSTGGTGDSYYKENGKKYDDSQVKDILAVSLDDYCKRNGILNPKIMKIDVQGAELDILKGSTAILEQVRLIQIELSFVEYNQGSPHLREIVEFLRGCGFVLVDILEALGEKEILQVDAVFSRD